MKHFASSDFWKFYNQLPDQIRRKADRQYNRLVADPRHPSLHFKKVGKHWSARVDDNYRALAAPLGNDFVWFWIGSHDQYDRLIK